MSGEHSDKSRRGFLKSAGILASGLASLGSVGSAAGKRGSAPTRRPRGQRYVGDMTYGQYNALLKKRKKKGWNTDRWRAELAKCGAEFSYMDSRVQVSRPPKQDGMTSESVAGPTVTVERMDPIDERQDNSGVGINHLHDDNVTLRLTYISSGTDKHLIYRPAHIDFSWSLKDPWTTSVQGPIDFATISIDPDQYTWAGDVEYGQYASASEAIDSMGFSYRNAQYDAAMHSDKTVGWFNSYMNVPIEPISGTPSSRKMYADYIARWENTEISGMSFSLGGDVSISFSSSTGLWRAETSATESEMDDGATYVDKHPV